MTWNNRALRISWLLILVSFFVGNAASSAKFHDSTDPKISSTAVATVTLNLRDFGAVGDGVADDGPALQAALDALANSGGGTLFVPAGHYALITPVAKDFSGLASSVVIVGETPFPVPEAGGHGRGLGLSSEFVVKVGDSANAIAISGLESFLIKDIAFAGVKTVLTDAKVVLTLAEITDATIQHCEFYGLASLVGGGAIVKSHHCNLKIHDSAFLGCATSSGLTTSVVQVNQWQGFTITGTRFVDYGNRAFYGKTPWSAPYSWIMVGGAASIDGASAWREVVIRDVLLDEGAFIGLSLRPELFTPSAPIDLFFISDLFMNVTNLGSYGHYLVRARRLFIEDSHYGWSHNSSGAMSISSGGEVILDQLECVDDANRIFADGNTEKLTVINSIYQELDSQARVTNVLNTSPGDDPVEIVRQQFLTSTGQEPEPAALFYWTSQLLNCGTDVQCQQQTRNALATFLSNQPQTRFTISGHVRESDGRSVAGATMTLNNSVSVQTDSNGFYSFANLPTSGTYTVAVARNNYTFTPASQVITTPLGNRVLDFTGVMRTFMLNGYLINPNGQGIPNITVTLSGPETRTVTTNSAGEYKFDDVRMVGPHVITPASPFFSFQPESITLNGLNQNTRASNIVGTRAKYTISGATGVPGTLLNLSGDASATLTSGADGNYSFLVDAGFNYTITASKQHYTFSPAIRVFQAISGNQTGENFAPILNKHTIGGNAGISGVTITLSGSTSASTISGASGAYSFTVDAGGNYTVTPAKTHYTFTPASQSITDLSGNVTVNFTPVRNTHTISGNAGVAGVTITISGSTGATAVTDASGAYSVTVNGGGNYTVTASKRHYTFSPNSRSFTDLSGNVTADFVPTIERYAISGSAGISGVVISISGSAAASAVTNASGAYSVTVNAGGNYTVTPSKTHYTFTPASQSITDLSSNVSFNFTPVLNKHTISGNAGMSGVTITLSGSTSASTISGADGAYSFTVNAGGNYSVTPSKKHYTFTPASQSITDLSGNVTVNFTPALNKHTIGGNAGLGGVTVTLSGSTNASTISGADGAYSFSVNAGGNYTVTPSKTHYTFTPASQSITDLSSNVTFNFTPALNKHTIGGNAGLGGVTVTLSGSTNASTISGADGTYSFSVNAGGNYSVTLSKTHYTFTPASQSITDLSSNVTFNFTPALNKHTIGGNAGLGGVTVTLSGSTNASTISGADGAYSFSVNAGGNYTVAPSMTHYTFTPASQSITDLSGNVSFNFTPVPNKHTISGNTGMSGVTITLSGSANASTITDSGGAYSHTVDAGGNYTITPSKTHYTFTPASQSITDLSGNVTFNFTPVLNKHTISGNAGISGVTITLSGSANASTITDSGGAYSHTVDAGGNYTLTAARTNYAFSPASYSFTNVSGNIPAVNFSAKPVPILLTEHNSTKAIALDSATWMREPFSLSGNHLSPDGLTRVMVFATNIDLRVGLPITAQAEDSQQRIIPLTVEYAGIVPGNNWLTQINVKLPSELTGNDRVWISLIVDGVASNKALILLKP